MNTQPYETRQGQYDGKHRTVDSRVIPCTCNVVDTAGFLFTINGERHERDCAIVQERAERLRIGTGGTRY